MADSFIDKLRNNNILGNLGQASTDASINPDAISAILNRTIPFLSRKRQEDKQFETGMMDRAANDALVQRSNAAKLMALKNPGIQNPTGTGGMNVVYGGDSAAPLQDARLSLQRDALTQRAQLASQKDTNSDEDRDIKQQRADTYDFRTKNPAKKLTAIKGGDMMAFDPLSGNMSDTGFNSGTMSDRDRMSTEQTNAADLITDRANAQGQVNSSKPTKQSTPAQSDYVLVMPPGGITAKRIPKNQLQDAIAHGGKLVQ